MSTFKETISIEESRLLYLAKGQYDFGIHGGTFTPGYVRKETGLGYNIIDSALDSLVADKLLERSRTTAYRQGAPVEIDLFRITEKGLQTVERIKSGTVRVGGSDAGRDTRLDDAHGSKVKQGNHPEAQSSIMQSARIIEAALVKALERTAELNTKVDRLAERSNGPALHDEADKGARKPAMKHYGKRSEAHWVHVLASLDELRGNHKAVLSGDIEGIYAKRCGAAGLPPKCGQSFGHLLKSMASAELVTLRLTGCRELGIKGHGSRLVVALTGKGEGFLKEKTDSPQPD